MEFCWIPAGEAQLGSPRAEQEFIAKAYFGGNRWDRLDDEIEGKRGKFTTRGFWLGRYEVTQAEWTAVMGNNPSDFNGKRPNTARGLDTSRFPVESVNWYEAQEFVAALNRRPVALQALGVVGRFCLPHEDEWEYACRGGQGNGHHFYWGNELNGTQANTDGRELYGTATVGRYLGRPAAVGSYANQYPHPWGLADMHGNVWEMCENRFSPGVNTRVHRGGSWGNNDCFARYCRAAYRAHLSPDYRNRSIGFRVCFRPD